MSAGRAGLRPRTQWTVREYVCVALLPSLSVAVTWMLSYVPAEPAAGVPPNLPVVVSKVIPFGREPV